MLLESDRALRRILSWEFADFGYDVETVERCQEARAALPLAWTF